MNIVSYGGGTQSTAMIMMALTGKYDLPRPDFGVYVDTGAEPQFICDYVDYFIEHVKTNYDFDIYKIKHKDGLEQEMLKPPKESKTGKFYTSSVPPFYTLAPDGQIGMLMRQCTSDFKIKPMSKFINSKIERGQKYRLWIGISFDERSRMKIAYIKKRENYYPLVDNFINRIDSINFIKLLGLRPPQRSSCVFCPFHSNRYWDWLKTYHPKEFDRACEFEKTIQENGLKWRNNSEKYLKHKVFLHSTCRPLGEISFMDKDQLSLFPELIDECDGLCGI